MNVTMEVSLYPLGDEHLSHAIDAFVEILKDHGCQVEVGPMSSLISGETLQVFEALRLGYEKVAGRGGCVLIVKASNVCPV